MKNKKMRISICAAVTLVAVMLATLFSSVGATEATPALSIDYCNLSFRDSVCIKYAVASNVDDVTVLIWNEPQTEYEVGTHDFELTSVETQTINEQSYMIFDYTELVAKQMTDVVYARAYAQSNGTDYYSEVNKYSILQYAYNKLGKTGTASTDEKLKTMLADMLTYGASAQKYFDYKTDRLATDDFYQVKLTEGLLDDGCNHGLYLPGDQVVLNAPETNSEGTPFSYWADSQGNSIGDAATYTLTVGAQNEAYTPVYVQYSANLEFDSNGDGTCYVIGMGTCEDTELVIPVKSPDGDTVIGIDASAFAGEAITSITLPNTIVDIGRRAFSNCTALTDVYYDGSEEEWADISIAAGNEPLTNAQIHFAVESAKEYTVTFVDHDGTELKKETVAEGESATAPADPSRAGYTFTGWNQPFNYVISDMVIVAQYQKITAPTIVVSNATAKAGDTVEITISLMNNPGISSLVLNGNYDSSLLLESVVFNSAMGGQFNPPQTMSNPIILNWYSPFANVTEDHLFMTLKFKVSDQAEAGKHMISMTYNPDNVYNMAEENVHFDVIDGYILIK